MPLGSASAKITSAPPFAAEMAAMRPAEEAPTTRTSQFTEGGGMRDKIKVSGGDELLGFYGSQWGIHFVAKPHVWI